MEDAQAKLATHQKMLKGTQEPPVVTDIKFIRCQVCELYVERILDEISWASRGLRKGQKLSETVILEKLESACNVDVPEGSWIQKLDIVEDGDRLLLNDTGKAAPSCPSECRTIAKACEEVQDRIDFNEFSEARYLGAEKALDLALAKQWLCSPTGVCRKPPAVPNDRKPGPKHATIKEHIKRQKEEARRLRKEARKAAAAEAKEAAAEEAEEASAEAEEEAKASLPFDVDSLPFDVDKSSGGEKQPLDPGFSSILDRQRKIMKGEL